jgi:cyclophilin family peptidyl-prolyl cis-trans isomerase
MNGMKKIHQILKKIFSYMFIVSLIFLVTSFDSKEKEQLVLLETNFGKLTFKLYNETPQHRDNMIKLVENKYYDSLIFHRVIKDFMIQCGDPNSKGAARNQMLGTGGPGYTIPAEFYPGLIHKKGAISAARLDDSQNPTKASSGSQFFIVEGRICTDEELNKIEEERISKKTYDAIRTFLQKKENEGLRNEIIGLQKQAKVLEYDKKIEEIKLMIPNEIAAIEKLRYTKEQREIYKTIGGSPHLDYDFTVFGEVVDGMETVSKIAALQTKDGRPRIDVVMKMSLIK